MRQALIGGEVHVWHASPAALGRSLSNGFELLSPDERTRLAAFVVEKDRALFLLGKVLLRTVLGRYFDVPASDWRFITTTHGKPHIDWPEAARSLKFSLAHTEGRAACAITSQRAVGIDVESTARLLDWDVVARRFAPDEYRQLRRMPHDKQHEAFFVLWTLKEAYAKACGDGVSALNDCRCELAEDGNFLAARVDRSSSSWKFFSFTLSAEHRVAIAAEERPDAELRMRILEIDLPDIDIRLPR